MRNSALARWALFVLFLCLTLVVLEVLFARAGGLEDARNHEMMHSQLPRELAAVRAEEPTWGELRVFLHVPTSGGRTLSDLANDVVPTWGTGLRTDFGEGDLEDLKKACEWPTFDVFMHGHLSMNDVLKFGDKPCGRRKTKFVVVVREPVGRTTSWLVHEAPQWLYDEFKGGRDRMSDFLLQEIENRLTYQVSDDAVYSRRDRNESRVLAKAKDVLFLNTVLYLDDIDTWMPDVGKCSGRRSKHVKSRHLQDARALDAADRANVAALNALDTALFAWIKRLKPHSDKWICLRGGG